MTFREALLQCGFAPLLEEQVSLLEYHFDLLTKWNRQLNLTAVSSLTHLVNVHFCESLMLPGVLPQGSLEIADVGSGAGFPGIPLAVIRPECNVWLIESHQRKAVFLREVVRRLPNVTIYAGRAEDVPRKFDWVVSRAVRPEALFRLRMASNFAIFTTNPRLASLPSVVRTVPIPGSQSRLIALFHVERDKIDSSA